MDREATADDVDGWDSLAHINLIIALEAAFGVKFSTAETSILKEEGQNVGSFVDLLAQKVAVYRTSLGRQDAVRYVRGSARVVSENSAHGLLAGSATADHARWRIRHYGEFTDPTPEIGKNARG